MRGEIGGEKKRENTNVIPVPMYPTIVQYNCCLGIGLEKKKKKKKKIYEEKIGKRTAIKNPPAAHVVEITTSDKKKNPKTTFWEEVRRAK